MPCLLKLMYTHITMNLFKTWQAFKCSHSYLLQQHISQGMHVTDPRLALPTWAEHNAVRKQKREASSSIQHAAYDVYWHVSAKQGGSTHLHCKQTRQQAAIVTSAMSKQCVC